MGVLGKIKRGESTEVTRQTASDTDLSPLRLEDVVPSPSDVDPGDIPDAEVKVCQKCGCSKYWLSIAGVFNCANCVAVPSPEFIESLWQIKSTNDWRWIPWEPYSEAVLFPQRAARRQAAADADSRSF